ncbi:MAG: hypothetical protein AB1402_05695 [Bacillota bacterium]
MPIHPTVAILQGLPESVVFVGLVFGLLGAGFHPGRTAFLGVLLLFLSFTVRAMGAPFPAHALFNMIVMSVVISLWSGLALQRVIFAWAAALTLLIAAEVSSTLLIQHLAWMTVDELAARPILWALAGWPQIIVLAIAAVWAYRHGGLKPFKGAAG